MHRQVKNGRACIPESPSPLQTIKLPPVPSETADRTKPTNLANSPATAYRYVAGSSAAGGAGDNID